MFDLMEVKFTNKDFKKKWNIFEIEGVKTVLQKAFEENYNITDIEDIFGLPYTSTGTYATLSNTNTQFEIEEGWNLEFFALTNNNLLVAIAWDENENERFYEVKF